MPEQGKPDRSGFSALLAAGVVSSGLLVFGSVLGLAASLCVRAFRLAAGPP